MCLCFPACVRVWSGWPPELASDNPSLCHPRPDPPPSLHSVAASRPHFAFLLDSTGHRRSETELWQRTDWSNAEKPANKTSSDLFCVCVFQRKPIVRGVHHVHIVFLSCHVGCCLFKSVYSGQTYSHRCNNSFHGQTKKCCLFIQHKFFFITQLFMLQTLTDS